MNITDISDYIETLLTGLEIPNGSPGLTSISTVYDPAWLNDDADATFPKAAIVLNRFRKERTPGNMLNWTVEFWLLLQVKSLTGGSATSKMVDLISAVDAVFTANPTLGGLVNDLDVTEGVMDPGILAPRSAAIIFITCTITEPA